MSLCSTVTVTDLAPSVSIVVAHGLIHKPHYIAATKPSAVTVVTADETTVTFRNDGNLTETVSFFCIHFHSIQTAPTDPLAHYAEGRLFAGTLWNAVAPVTIGNTNVETTQFSPTIVGSPTLPPNLFTLGKQIRIETRGIISCGNAQDATFRIKLGAFTLVAKTGTLPNGQLNDYIESLFDLVCYETGPAGRIRGTGRTLIGPASGAVGPPALRPLVMTADQVLDTRLSYLMDYTYQWANAAPGNTVTITSASIRTLN